MERVCKNCNHIFYEKHNYCSNCGSKWIENRITMRNVAADFGDMYLGIDTKFVRTFLDMFTKPRDVINGYIKGRRMNYVDAIRYLFISLFFTGITVFVMKHTEIEFLNTSDLIDMYKRMGIPEKDAITQANAFSQSTEFTQNYMSIIVLLSIPIYALWGRITFWGKKKYNYTEQLVIQMYSYSQYAIATTPIAIAILVLAPDYYGVYTIFTLLTLFLYNVYVYQQLFKLDLAQTVMRSLLFFVVAIVSYIGLIILVVLAMIMGMIVFKFLI
ncbi:MAG: DUF3667 domain-containing protein [Bacteroidota bacterium]|nr:DUF3667 domain-containing protein [Bacteroidota bacterium]